MRVLAPTAIACALSLDRLASEEPVQESRSHGANTSYPPTQTSTTTWTFPMLMCKPIVTGQEAVLLHDEELLHVSKIFSGIFIPSKSILSGGLEISVANSFGVENSRNEIFCIMFLCFHDTRRAETREIQGCASRASGVFGSLFRAIACSGPKSGTKRFASTMQDIHLASLLECMDRRSSITGSH